MNTPSTPAPPLAAVDYDPFAGPALARVVPVTEPQREIWLADRIGDEASLAYNEAVAITLDGELDVAALAAALEALVARHESMRATFSPDGGELCIAESGSLPLALDDLAGLDDTARAAARDAALGVAVSTRFDLERGPLFRARLLRFGPRAHLLLLSAHHIVCDGWSFGVIARELLQLYAARRLGAAPVLPPAPSFADYALAAFEHTAAADGGESERYWLARHASAAPPLELPLDRPRPRQRGFASARADLVFDAELVAALRQLGAARRASLFATLFTGFVATLARLAGQRDLVVGVAAAGQASGGNAQLVGHCVNILPVRVELDVAESFEAALGRVRMLLLDAFEHQDLTFGTLLQKLALPRDPARPALVSVLFNLDQALELSDVAPAGVRVELASVPRVAENFELFLNVVPTGAGLRLECQYNTGLFDERSVWRWLVAYRSLMRGAVADAATPLGRLPLLDEAGRAELRALQPPPSPFDAARLAHQHFEAQADATPERSAVRDGERRLSYRELEQRANRIAHALRARGAGRGGLVGIALERGADMVAAVLGVLKSGAGYVPLDPAFPPERLDFMIADAALAVLLTDATHAPRFAVPGRTLLVLDEAALATVPDTRLAPSAADATPDSPAYVIYTSGSTGRPKGVVVPHRATANFVAAMQAAPGIAADDRLVAVTTLSFDIAFLELMLPLSVGAEVVVASRAETSDGIALRGLLESSEATMMQATPSGWRLLVDSGWRGTTRFTALCGGEPLPSDLAELLARDCGACWNLYGPTESTVWSSAWRVTRPRDGIRIGRPVANTEVWVLDEAGQPLPVGVPGELWIGGAGVADGYLGRPELTAERFVDGVAPGLARGRTYRTGDRGRWRNDGLLEHLGRLDFQVKLRGYRIELGEVESALLADGSIARAAAVTREDRPGDVRLVAYVVPAPGAQVDEAAAKALAARRLPDYMLPQHVLVLEALPLLPNGKLDRKALPAPADALAARARARIAPRDATEAAVARAMQDVLALPELSVDDDFFRLGGHSLLAARLVARLNREFDVALSFRSVFDRPTIEGLAQSIAAGRGGLPALPPVRRRADRRRAPLSLMQRRLWFLEELNPGRVTYNTPSAHRLTGPLDEAAFQRAFDALIARHAALRTAIRREGDDAVQLIEDCIVVSLFPAEDLSALAPEARESEVLARMQALTDQPFDLGTAPLFRARMYRLAEAEHVLFFMPHHMIWDGWSFDLFYAEMASLYAAFAAGREPEAAAAPVDYGDFAEWHAQWLESPHHAAQCETWRARLADLPTPRELRADRRRRPGMSGEGRTEWLRIDAALAERLHSVARELDATPNMLLLAAYAVALRRATGERRLVIGTPVRGRNAPEVEAVMGYFTNLVPLHLEVDAELSFAALVARFKAVVLDAFAAPDVPLETLQRELKGRNGDGNVVLYQALFSFQDARARPQYWGALQHEPIPLFQRGATEDLGVWFLDTGRGMIGGVTYNADIWLDATAAMLRDRLLEIIARVLHDTGQPVAALLAPFAADEALLASAAPAATVDPLAALAQHAIAHGARLAVDDGGFGVSIAELWRLSDAAAAGVDGGQAAPIALDGSAPALAAALGAWRRGAAIALEGASALAPVAPLALGDVAARAVALSDCIGPGLRIALAPEASDGGALLESLAILLAGSAIAALPVAATHDAQELRRWFETRRPDAGWLSAALWQDLLDAGYRPSGGMLALVDTDAGDPVVAALRAHGADVITLVGGAAHGGPVARLVEDAADRAALIAPLGAPLEVLDDDGVRALPGVAGELAMAGPSPRRAGVAARVACDGRLELLDALPATVRPRGRRVDLAMLAARLAAAPGTAEAHLRVLAGAERRPTVLAYVAPVAAPAPEPALARALAAGGIVRVALERLPRDAAGAIDETALPVPVAQHAAAGGTAANGGSEAPASETERRLAALWSELLGVPTVRRDDNFFDLGGHSLLVMQAVARMQQDCGKRINARAYLFQSLAQIAAAYDEAAPEDVPEGGLFRRLFGARRGKGRKG